MVDDTRSGCQCWAWRRHCCSNNNAARHGLGTSAQKYLLPFSSATACIDCFESPLHSQASLSNSLLHFPPTLPALQHRCSSTTSSCPILPSVFCKNHHLCKAFYRCSQPALILPCLAEHSHPILLSVSCPQPQWRSTEPMFGDFSSRYAPFTMMLSPGPALPQQLTCLSSPPWSGDQDHQNIKAFCFLT